MMPHIIDASYRVSFCLLFARGRGEGDESLTQDSENGGEGFHTKEINGLF